MSFDKIKANKQQLAALSDAGYSAATELQSKILSRILGGQDVVAIAPEGCGKTSSIVISTIIKLNYALDEAPRVLVIVPDRDHVEALIQRFELLGKNTNLRIVGLHNGVQIDAQREELADGVDVVIGTPDRTLAIYLRSGLNVNRLKMFVIDDGDLIIKQGLQTLVHQLTESLPKCQHVVFTEVYHDKLDRLLSYFLINPAMVEVDGVQTNTLKTITQHLYKVPNYKTKINLLNLLLADDEVFDKIIVFVNTRATASKVYKSLERRFVGAVGMLKPSFGDQMGIEEVSDFVLRDDLRMLIVANQDHQALELEKIPFFLHFDLPPDKETFINRVTLDEYQKDLEPISITFSTDIELSNVRKIETATGKKMEVHELPLGLVIEGNQKKESKTEEDQIVTGAFQEKKASNAKNYNLGMKEKLKIKAKNEKYSKKKG